MPQKRPYRLKITLEISRGVCKIDFRPFRQEKTYPEKITAKMQFFNGLLQFLVQFSAAKCHL